jgi:AraC family transcriptional regulator
VDTRITDRSAFRLVGYAVRVPLIHRGRNPDIEAHIAALPAEEHGRLKALEDTEPTGLLQVSADVDPDYAEGSQFTFLFGVALDTSSPVPDGLDVIEVSAGTWAVIRTTASYPSAWMTIVSEWFPSNPWRLRPGPSILTDRGDEHSTATAEVWIPVERA